MLGLFLRDTAASAALEPVLLAAKPLPFVQMQLYPWKAAERCCPSQDSAVLRDLPAPQPCTAAQPREEDLGVGMQIPLFCRADGGWMQSGAGSTMSIQPVTPDFCHVLVWDICLRDQRFSCATKSQMLKAWWPSCSHGDGDVVKAESERSFLHGQNWKAESRESFHVQVSMGSSEASRREGLGEKNHRMGESVVPMQPGIAA